MNANYGQFAVRTYILSAIAVSGFVFFAVILSDPPFPRLETPNIGWVILGALAVAALGWIWIVGLGLLLFAVSAIPGWLIWRTFTPGHPIGMWRAALRGAAAPLPAAFVSVWARQITSIDASLVIQILSASLPGGSAAIAIGPFVSIWVDTHRPKTSKKGVMRLRRRHRR